MGQIPDSTMLYDIGRCAVLPYTPQPQRKSQPEYRPSVFLFRECPAKNGIFRVVLRPFQETGEIDEASRAYGAVRQSDTHQVWHTYNLGDNLRSRPQQLLSQYCKFRGMSWRLVRMTLCQLDSNRHSYMGKIWVRTWNNWTLLIQ